MPTQSHLFTDEQMQRYIVDGYVTVQTNFPAQFHAKIHQQAETILDNGNPWNDIYPLIPELGDVFADPAVDGALTSILGPGYIMHPHRHCHFNPPGNAAQQKHNDSYEEDENVRHHRTRWAMAFYYPQAVTLEMGPSAIQPGTQYYTSRTEAEQHPEIALTGQAGAVTITHYDLWHRALANRSDKKRYMMKFLFCRMEEPQRPSWNAADPKWQTPVNDHTPATTHESLWQQMWDWHIGSAPLQTKNSQEFSASSSNHGPNGTVDGSATKRSSDIENEVQCQVIALYSPSEADRIDAAYRLGKIGAPAIPKLMDALQHEVDSTIEKNIQAHHTNPSQFQAGHALTAIGAPAVPALIDALSARKWGLRAAAADILGDIGLAAAPAVPALIIALQDESEWVRRNAIESLGTLGSAAEAAVPTLAERLIDEAEIDWVRHNAALALARIGPAARVAIPQLRQVVGHENLYISGNSQIALARIEG